MATVTTMRYVARAPCDSKSAGHLPMLTRSDEFNRAIVAFLGGELVGE